MSATAVYTSSATSLSVTLESNGGDQAAAMTGGDEEQRDRGGEEEIIASATPPPPPPRHVVEEEEISRESLIVRLCTGSVPQPLPMSDRAVGGAPQLPIAPSQEHLLQTGEDKHFLEFPTFTEDDVRKALKNEVQKHKMWRTAAVKRMNILNIDTSMALRYSLETFLESRSTVEGTEPYSGQAISDGFHFDAEDLSNVWEFPCPPSRMFTAETRFFELPGTTQLHNCTSCAGQGQSHCFHCRGFGTSRCAICNGTGMKTGVPHPAVVTHPLIGSYANSKQTTGGYPGAPRSGGPPAGGNQSYGLGTPIHFHSMTGFPPPGVASMDLCYLCHGRGVKECHHCRGQGKKACGVCGGCGQMRTFSKLKVKYEVDKLEYLHEVGIPEKLMQRVTGEVILTETRPFVLPVKNFPIEAINDHSRRFIQIHLSKYLGLSKILQQRHMLEAVPVADVAYELNGQQGRFWVVGLERIAYAPQYPAKCSIL